MNNFSFTVIEPPKYIFIGTRKYYLTAQMWYSGIHWAVRKKIKDSLKPLIYAHLSDCPNFGCCRISIVFHYKKMDVDNTGYLWNKIIQDCMVDKGIVKDDDCTNIHGVSWDWGLYQKGMKEFFTVTIEGV